MQLDPETVQTAPDSFLFPPGAKKKLTSRQKKFARGLAMGETKAEAYRQAYNVKSPYSLTKDPYKLANHPAVAHEVQAIQAAIQAQEYQTPSALRALVINSLVKVITDPDSKPGQITAAAKVLGTVTEVAAFTERKEVRTISSSEDARARVLEQLRSIVKADAQDVQSIEADADSLLAELHPPATPHVESAESQDKAHTIPHEQSPSSFGSEISPDPDPTPSIGEHPPS